MDALTLRTSPEKKRLIELLRERSYREGDFTLASGKKSKFYLDTKQTSLHPEGASLLGNLFLELTQAAIKTGYFGTLTLEDIPAVAGLTLGADPLVTAFSLIAYQNGHSILALIVRKEPKAHGTSKWVEGKDHLPAGSNVLVLEDVTTTGGSSLKAVDRLREEGLNPIGVLTIVDREEGAADIFRDRKIPFGRLAVISELQS